MRFRGGLSGASRGRAGDSRASGRRAVLVRSGRTLASRNGGLSSWSRINSMRESTRGWSVLCTLGGAFIACSPDRSVGCVGMSCSDVAARLESPHVRALLDCAFVQSSPAVFPADNGDRDLGCRNSLPDQPVKIPERAAGAPTASLSQARLLAPKSDPTWATQMKPHRSRNSQSS